MMPLRRLWRRLHRREEGQAATEYVIMSSYILVAGVLGTPFIMRFAPEMINFFQMYVDGFYFIFSLPIP